MSVEFELYNSDLSTTLRGVRTRTQSFTQGEQERSGNGLTSSMFGLVTGTLRGQDSGDVHQ